MIKEYKDKEELKRDILRIIDDYCPDKSRFSSSYLPLMFGSDMTINIRMTKDYAPR